MASDRESCGAVPDPNRVGGPGWLSATGGRLTAAQKRQMLVVSLTTQRRLIAQKIRRRRPTSVDLSEIANFPDSRLVREAEEAALVQSPQILGHAYRTALFARALAKIDGVDVDDELLVVCGLLHDAGLVPSVLGQDFTVRSAAIACEVANKVERPETCDHLADAIIVHTTVGINVERDGALGVYTQFGAMVDLIGFRERHLPHDFVARTVAAHPRDGLKKKIAEDFRSEARAVPGGRFAFLRGVGFIPIVRMNSVPSRRS